MRITARKVAEKENKCVPLSPADSKRFQKLLADIGSHKKRGFIMVCEVTSVKIRGKDCTKVEGLQFAHKINKAHMMKSMLERAQLDFNDYMELLNMDAPRGLEVSIKNKKK